MRWRLPARYKSIDRDGPPSGVLCRTWTAGAEHEALGGKLSLPKILRSSPSFRALPLAPLRAHEPERVKGNLCVASSDMSVTRTRSLFC